MSLDDKIRLKDYEKLYRKFKKIEVKMPKEVLLDLVKSYKSDSESEFKVYKTKGGEKLNG